MKKAIIALMALWFMIVTGITNYLYQEAYNYIHPLVTTGYVPVCRNGAGTAQCVGALDPASGGLGKAYSNTDATTGQAPVFNGTIYVPTTVLTVGSNGSCLQTFTFDVAGTAGQVVKLVPATNHALIATGNTAGSGLNVVGVLTANVAINAIGTVDICGFYTAVGLAQGPLYRDTSGNLVLYATLASGDFTNRICNSATTAGCVLAVTEEMQKP